MTTSNKDWAQSLYVDSFATAELVMPKASVIGLRLHGSGAAPGDVGHRDLPYLLRMTPDRARSLAEALIEAADEIDGTTRNRH